MHNPKNQQVDAEVELFFVKTTLATTASADPPRLPTILAKWQPLPPVALVAPLSVPPGGFGLARFVWDQPPDPDPDSPDPYRAYLLIALVKSDDDPLPDRTRVDATTFWSFFSTLADSRKAAIRGIRYESLSRVEIEINNSSDPRARYVTWTPSPCQVRLAHPAGATAPAMDVVLTASSENSAGAVGLAPSADGPFTSTLTVAVSPVGPSATFFVAGKFGRPSSNDRDVLIEARSHGVEVGSVRLMVRIRKNANTLTDGERDRFLWALAVLNDRGAGV